MTSEKDLKRVEFSTKTKNLLTRPDEYRDRFLEWLDEKTPGWKAVEITLPTSRSIPATKFCGVTICLSSQDHPGIEFETVDHALLFKLTW